MASDPRRPLLNPVLRFTKDPRPESITGRGKSPAGIKTERLATQRARLSSAIGEMAQEGLRRPHFGGRAVAYAAMFEDSLAPTWTPSDLFQTSHGARLIAPHASGYLVELELAALPRFSAFIRNFGTVRDEVDISRVEMVRFYDKSDVLQDRAIDSLWEQAVEQDGGRAFFLWLTPFRTGEAAEQLLLQFAGLRDGIIAPTRPQLPDLASAADAAGDRALAHALRAIPTDRVGRALREYRQRRRARTSVLVPSREALGQLVASGTVVRLDPVMPIVTTQPGEGREPDRPLPANLSNAPIVGVVDGGLDAGSYVPAEAWRAPPLVSGAAAEVMHGNRVTSLIVQGYDWNNNLTLPALTCRVGTAAAIAKRGHRGPTEEDLIDYLDAVIGAHPETKVWNLSFNQDLPQHRGPISSR
jgi:hypothetical protein